jgi:hypothetical protein
VTSLRPPISPARICKGSGGGYPEVTTTHSELFADVAASIAVSKASSGNVCVRMERMSSTVHGTFTSPVFASR